MNARLTGAPAQPLGNPQSRFQSRPPGSHDLAKFFADSAAGLIVPSVIGWIADFLRLAWSLLYWNTRKTLWPRRGRGGRTYGQNPREAGQSSVSSVAAHTPDACWPGAGWTAVPDPVKRDTPLVGARTLAPAEYRVFSSGGRPQHVWFWHLFDGRPTTFADPYNLVELFGLAWRYGFRRDGDHLFFAFQATARGRNSPPSRSSPRRSPDSNPSASKSAFLPRHAFCHHSSRTRRPRRHRVDHYSRFARTVGAVEFCCDFPATFSSPLCTSLHLFPISTRMSLQLHAIAVVLRSFPILRVLRGTA